MMSLSFLRIAVFAALSGFALSSEAAKAATECTDWSKLDRISYRDLEIRVCVQMNVPWTEKNGGTVKVRNVNEDYYGPSTYEVVLKRCRIAYSGGWDDWQRIGSRFVVRPNGKPDTLPDWMATRNEPPTDFECTHESRRLN